MARIVLTRKDPDGSTGGIIVAAFVGWAPEHSAQGYDGWILHRRG